MRAFLLFLLCFSFCFFASTNSFADANANKEAARKTLSASVTRIMDYITNPAYKNLEDRKRINKDIEKEVYIIFDFTEFSMRTVGSRWKSFSQEQQKNFVDAFADLLFSTYLDSVDGYNGEQVQYIGETSNSSGSRVEVRNIVTIANGEKVPVFYRMLMKNGDWRVYDVLIEGISLVKNYRSQFSDILAKDSPEELTARIRERADELRKKIND